MSGNNDFLTLGHTLEQGGQMGFGFKSTDSNHMLMCHCGLSYRPVYHLMMILSVHQLI